MARPFTKPSITGYGTIRMNLPSFSQPADNLYHPHGDHRCKQDTAHRNRSPKSRSASATSETMTTASAPVAPEIIPGRPPMNGSNQANHERPHADR